MATQVTKLIGQSVIKKSVLEFNNWNSPRPSLLSYIQREPGNSDPWRFCQQKLSPGYDTLALSTCGYLPVVIRASCSGIIIMFLYFCDNRLKIEVLRLWRTPIPIYIYFCFISFLKKLLLSKS